MRKYNQGVADSNRRRVKHGATVGHKEGKTDPLYFRWRSIKQRCLDPGASHYDRYGGRGINMCQEWAESFSAFRAAVGPIPAGLTLDRVDNDKGYEPGNVRWATRKKQANNRHNTRRATYKGETKSLKEWAEVTAFSYPGLTGRWNKGLRDEELFADFPHARGKEVEFRGEVKTLREWSRLSGVSYYTLYARWRAKQSLFRIEL